MPTKRKRSKKPAAAGAASSPSSSDAPEPRFTGTQNDKGTGPQHLVVLRGALPVWMPGQDATSVLNQAFRRFGRKRVEAVYPDGPELRGVVIP